MNEQPTPEHDWLMQLLGAWTCESECQMGPGQPPMQTKGTETVRSLGGLWTLGEGTMGTEEGAGKSLMTLGYDPKAERFVGTFIASMMTYLWTYRGTLNAARTTLTLDAEGPSFAGDGSMAKYQDIIEFQDADHRTLTSRMLLPSGEWVQFMHANYVRVGK